MTGRRLLSCFAGLVLVPLALSAAPAPVMLQIGAFLTSAEAETASARFRQTHATTLQGVPSEVRRADLGPRGTWFRVLVGPFPDRSAADSTCSRLKAAGGACFLAPGEPAGPEPPQKSVEAKGVATTSPSDSAKALPPWILAAASDQKGAATAPAKGAATSPVPSPPAPAATRPPPAATAGAQAEFARVLGLAEKGDAAAELQLAGLYRAGRGVARDEAAAIHWYRAAAEKGLPEAQFELGKIYDTGVGGPRDPFEAVRWYRLSAQQGYGRAQYNLGSMHGNGEGVPVDYLKAYVWFSISEATLAPGEREAARSAKGQAAQLLMPDELQRALQMAQRCLTSAYQNCD